MATSEDGLTRNEERKLKRFAEALPDEPEEINVEEIAQQAGINRRQALQVIAAVGVGSIAGGVSVSQLVSEAQAQASTSDGDGNVGTPADRVDVFADGVDASVIDTEEAGIKTSRREQSDRPFYYRQVFSVGADGLSRFAAGEQIRVSWSRNIGSSSLSRHMFTVRVVAQDALSGGSGRRGSGIYEISFSMDDGQIENTIEDTRLVDNFVSGNFKLEHQGTGTDAVDLIIEYPDNANTELTWTVDVALINNNTEATDQLLEFDEIVVEGQ